MNDTLPALVARRVQAQWHGPIAAQRRALAAKDQEAARRRPMAVQGASAAPVGPPESVEARIKRLKGEVEEAAKRWGLKLTPLSPDDAAFSLCWTAAGYSPDELGPKIMAWLQALADTLPEVSPEDYDDGGGA